MRVVDTSAWVEWLIDSSHGKAVIQELPQRTVWLVPTIVQFELVKWATRELGKHGRRRVLALSRTRNVIPLSTKIAVRAAEVRTKHKLAMADAIVYATAQLYEADVLTCDSHFESLPGVKFIDKRG